MSTKLTSLLCVLCCTGMLHAQSFWTDVSLQHAVTSGETHAIPQHFRGLRLDVAAMQNLLASATQQQPGISGLVITLPLPDGGSKRFQVFETPVMAPALQARYPETRCYTGRGIDDPTTTLKCDLTPWGFHAMIRSKQEGSIFIDPYTQGSTEYYLAYFKKDLLSKGETLHFSCGVDRPATDETGLFENDDNSAPEFQGDCQLRHYRLALACTGEYAAFHGGTKPLVLAAMNTSMNRVNGLYENDLAVTMQIVANNDTLIFLNATTDPYNNNNGGTMLNQNVTTCNSRIGVSNYDIGHVFSTGGGGIAGLGVICTGSKAQGVTGQDTPIGDGFDIDYVAHEMGHQFGANHTQNNNCNRVQGAAMEPGSASTIMGYAGICAPDVQAHSDAYFHAISVQEIGLYITTSDGNTCPVKTVTGNNKPTVNGGANYTIPRSTPFALTATGSDTNGDPLTYCWEQMDPQFATMPPNASSTGGPMFRSFDPTPSPTRYFPRLADLVNNINPTWEKLPDAARTMNFRVTARDNNPAGGCTGEDDVLLTVTAAAGPFVVTEPNTNVLWYIDDNKTVTWNVSSTDVAPVNCSNVRILLSTDGGFTYPVVLAENVPNTGSANVIVPDNVSNTCRVKVEAIGNIFFDISNQNFRIQPAPFPSFALVNSVNELSICAGDTSSFTIQTFSIAGFENPVDLTVSGAPFGAAVVATPGQIPASGTATIRLTNITPLMSGTYSLIVKGVSGTLQAADTIALTIFPGAPPLSSTLSPADGVSGLGISTTLAWEEVNFATSYTVQLATTPSFSNPLYNQTQVGTSAVVSNLQAGGVYYWRVRASNLCGDADFSEVVSFQVQNLLCNQTFSSIDVPLTLATNSASTALSVLNVPDVAVIGSVQVNMQANHTWVGDLDAVLSTPWGLDIQLFDRPGIPASTYGCGNNNLNLSFSDQATQSAAILENQCNTSNPALSGTFQPIQPLSGLIGQGATGDWHLALRDNDGSADGGSLNSWSLNFCFLSDIPEGAFVHNNTLLVPQAGSAGVTSSYLQVLVSGAAAQVSFTVLQIPTHGILLLNGIPVETGGTFTQDDLDNNRLTYFHNGDESLSDNFYFDALDHNNTAWLHNQVFSIQIIQNNLSATATLTQTLACHNGSDASINVEASGLDGVYMYSLNDGEPQSSNVFSGLSAGEYTISVIGQLGFTANAGSITIADPVELAVSSSVNDDQIAVTATGGTGVYSYSIDGENFQPSNIFNSVANGFYTVTVQDANGCTATSLALVALNSLLAIAETTQQISCFGNNDGRISVNAAGSQPPFEYSLNGVDFQTSNVFSGLEPGSYTVTVRDAGGMMATTEPVTITEPDQLMLEASITDINNITVTTSGGTAPYMLTINGIDTTAYEFTNLNAGAYTFLITDANGCSFTTVTTVFENTLSISLLAVGPVSCAGDSDGVIGICVDGGNGTLAASISPAAGIYLGSTGNCALLATYTDLPPGVYSVTISDAVGFSITANATVATPEPIVVSASNLGDTIIVSATGGTFTYEYSLDGMNWQGSPFFPGLPDGLYTVYARDIKMCSASAEFFLNNVKTIDLASSWGLSVSPNPGSGLFQLTLSQAPAALRGDIFDMTGRSLHQYDFNAGSGNFQTVLDVHELPQGIYVLRLTDGVQSGAVRLSIVR